MARPLGSPNKRSTHLLYKLEHEHNFHIVEKIVHLYEQTEQLYKPLFEKVVSLMERQLPIPAIYDRETHTWSEGLRPAEMELFSKVRGDLWEILAKLLSYSYPKLKGLEVNTNDSDKVIFNISIPKTGNRDIDISSVKLQQDDGESEETVH